MSAPTYRPPSLDVEVTLVACTLAAVVGFARIFEGWGFLVPLAIAALASHGIAIAMRRSGVGVVAAAAASLTSLAVVITVGFARGTAAFGVLPTRSSWDTVGTALSDAWSRFDVVKPLIAFDGGYAIAAIAGVWVAALLADMFGMRARATLEALAPSALLFMFAAFLAADRLRWLMTALYVVTAVLWAAAHRAWLQSSAPGWLAPRSGRSVPSLAIGAVVAAAVALATVAVAPALPGVGAEPIIDPNPGGTGPGGTRVTLSPLVDIKGRISNNGAVEAFRVRTVEPRYWRLMSLDTFDGSVWRSDASYRKVRGGDLPGDGTNGPSTGLQATFTVSGLVSDWLPSPYRPERIDGMSGTAYDSDSASILAPERTDRGLTYTVRAQVPAPTSAQLSGIPLTADDDVKRYLELPADYPQALRDTATTVVQGATTPYAIAIALQDWFRTTFTYQLDVTSGHGERAIESFLARRTGYCEQFAGTFAAFARSLGVPARVAVGFTPGIKQPDGSYLVRDEHAHAWPEVWFDGVGWVPFEPTPSRGIPGAQGYTGVPAQQSGEAPEPDDPAVTTTVSPTGSTTATSARPFQDPGDLGSLSGASGATTTADRMPAWLRVLVVLALAALALLVWITIVAVGTRVRRARRRARARDHGDEVVVAWAEALDALQDAGFRLDRAETPSELVARAIATFELRRDPLARLASATDQALFAPDIVTEETAVQAKADAAQLESVLAARRSTRRRLTVLVDPEPLLRRAHPALVRTEEPVRTPVG